MTEEALAAKENFDRELAQASVEDPALANVT